MKAIKREICAVLEKVTEAEERGASGADLGKKASDDCYDKRLA